MPCRVARFGRAEIYQLVDGFVFVHDFTVDRAWLVCSATMYISVDILG